MPILGYLSDNLNLKLDTFMRAIWKPALPEYSAVKPLINEFTMDTRPMRQCSFMMSVIYFYEFSVRAKFLFGDDEVKLDMFHDATFKHFKQSLDRKRTFVSYAETYSGILYDALLSNLSYAQFSRMLSDKSESMSHNSRILLEKFPRRVEIKNRMASEIGKQITHTLPKLRSIDSERGLKSRVVVGKVVIRQHGGDDVVINTLNLTSNASIFEKLTNLENAIRCMRDGLCSIDSRMKRSFKSMATKKRPGVYEMLDLSRSYFANSWKETTDVSALSKSTVKKVVAISVLFQTFGKDQLLSRMRLSKKAKVNVSEILLLVEIDDNVGSLGARHLDFITNAQPLLVKSSTGLMNSVQKERMMSIQNILGKSSQVSLLSLIPESNLHI